MELAEVWTEAHGAVCQIVHLRNGTRLGSGSGFMIGNRLLITNNHVIQPGSATHVHVRFVGPDGHTAVAEAGFKVAEFAGRLRDGEPETSWDFAVLDIDVPEFQDIDALELAPTDDLPIGSPVALLGFQFEQANLSVHAGSLSARYTQASVDYLQLDASVNHGSSGGPLIDVGTGLVVGVVTRKATGLTKQFDDLLDSFDANAKAFEAVQGTVTLSGIDVFQVLTITQHQMKQVSAEIARSANVGIGYAYALRKIRESLNSMET